MGSNENLTNSTEPVVHKFGDEDLSDVTFIVGGEEFKCNKMVLANRSSYFKAMFFSDFTEKDQKTVSIEADPVAFKNLMELIYTGQFSGWENLLTCRRSYSERVGSKKINRGVILCASVTNVWTVCTNLLKLADQFDILSYTVAMLENYFLRTTHCCSDQIEECSIYGTKLLIAVMYGMEEFKRKCTATRKAVAKAVKQIRSLPTAVSIDFAHFQWFMEKRP